MTFGRYIFIALGVCALTAANAAQPGDEAKNKLIDGSYIITFRPSTASFASPIMAGKRYDQVQTRGITAFGEHGTGQSKSALKSALGIRGQVKSIFDMINAAHLYIEADEAERLKKDPRVLRVEQSRLMLPTQSVQNNPGWALDRLDQNTTVLDGKYIYNADGAGRLIYILDTGLTLSSATAQAEFGGRATVFWDVNGLDGKDCFGHGTNSASIAAGNNYGVAKGATIRAVKMTVGCQLDADPATFIMAFNWLAVNAARGTIVNMSYGFETGLSCPTALNSPEYTLQALDDAIAAAHDAGTIVVVSAGNDQCDTAFFTPTRIPQAFVVGATSSNRFAQGQDAKAADSRTGANVSVFAPGLNVPALGAFGNPTLAVGTSAAAPYIAGLFAVGCTVVANDLCRTGSITDVYNAMRSIGVIGTVVMPDGTALPAGTTSRFVNRGVW